MEPRTRTVLQWSLFVATLAILVLFGIDPSAWFTGFLVLLAVPALWRLLGMPIWLLAGLEGALLLWLLGVQFTCGRFVDCGIDYMHPWHFLPDMIKTVAVVGTLGIVLSLVPSWARRGDRWVRTGLAVGVAVALGFVYYFISPFVPLVFIEGTFGLYFLVFWLGGALLAGSLAYFTRAWWPVVAAVVVVLALNVNALETCEAGEAMECDLSVSQDSSEHPTEHGAFALTMVAVAVGAVQMRKWREIRRDEGPARSGAPDPSDDADRDDPYKDRTGSR